MNCYVSSVFETDKINLIVNKMRRTDNQDNRRVNEWSGELSYQRDPSQYVRGRSGTTYRGAKDSNETKEGTT